MARVIDCFCVKIRRKVKFLLESFLMKGRHLLTKRKVKKLKPLIKNALSQCTIQ